ncbi:MAG: response regulator [Elusimicrobiota bacterium]
MGYRVLIVDDSPVLRIMMQEMLESLGHQIVAEAGSGEAALNAYRANKPDLVTLDISLPDMNGLEVLEKMRRIDPSANVLIVTGNNQKEIERRATALRALGVLHKPFDEEDLTALLEKVAARMRSRPTT